MTRPPGKTGKPRPRGAGAKTAPLAGKKSGTRGVRSPSVAILGGGLSGLMAALRLGEAGFAVTLFERSDILGGNTSSPRDANGREHDVYPHLFCGWYANFWNLFENDLGRRRSDHFDPREGVKMLHKGSSEFSTIRNPTSIEAMVANMRSGVMSPAQTFLLAFYGLDLVAHPFDRSGLKQLQELDVNGFLYSRGYSTEAVAKMENYILTLIWSIQSDQTAAATYQNFLRHTFTFPSHEPFAWFMRGSLSDVLIAPLEAKLKGLGCDIRLGSEITALRIGDDDRPLVSTAAALDQPFDFAVCALPPEALSRLVMSPHVSRPGRKLVDIVPRLAETQRLQSVSIPVLNLVFKRRLADFPSDIIGLAGSTYGLSVLDVSQLWQSHAAHDHTRLVIAASNAAALPSAEDDQQAWLMIRELGQYFPSLALGTSWGDETSDIDWALTSFGSNAAHRLTLNEVGSWPWRPQTHYPRALPRVAFAGDLVQNEVDMATVEGAAITGIQAARAVQAAEARLSAKEPLGTAIECAPHQVYDNASLRLAYLALLPVAYGAFAKVAFDQWRSLRDQGKTVGRDGQYLLIDYLALVPLQFAIDWWKAAYWFSRSLKGEDATPAELGDLGGDDEDFGFEEPEEQVAAPGAPKDRAISLGSAIMMTLGECADYAIGRLAAQNPPDGGGKDQVPGSLLGSALAMAQAFARRSQENGPATPPRPVRRGRIKR